MKRQDDSSEPDATTNSVRLFELLAHRGIDAETIEHPAAMTCADILEYSLPAPACKNLFLKDSRNKLWLLIALPETTVHLKKLAEKIDAPELRFAQAALLEETLGVKPGSVTLFGILNDTTKRVTVLIDKAIYEKERVGFHPFYNTATTFIKTADIDTFVKACGSPQKEIDFDEA